MKSLLRWWLGRSMGLFLRWRSQPYPFPAGSALIVAPHADDETLGCGGLIAAKAARGHPVHVVFVTDSAGAPEQKAANDLAARRRQEALDALDRLGVSGLRVHFLNAPDGCLNRLAAAESARLEAGLDGLLHRLLPDEVFVPYLGGGSSEHDATTGLVRAALTRTEVRARLWEYPVWGWWDARRLRRQLGRPEQNYFHALGSLRAQKRQALSCHASQLEPSAGGAAPGLPSVLAALCTGPREFYFSRRS